MRTKDLLVSMLSVFVLLVTGCAEQGGEEPEAPPATQTDGGEDDGGEDEGGNLDY